VSGCGLWAGLALVPHYDDIRRTAWQEALDRLAPGGIGYLGLDERTGAISDGVVAGGGRWRGWGAGGAARVPPRGGRAAPWSPRGAVEPTIARHGETIDIPD